MNKNLGEDVRDFLYRLDNLKPNTFDIVKSRMDSVKEIAVAN